MQYLIHLAIMIGIYMIVAQGFNLCFGVGRLFNLAHVAAYSLGAYATALLSTEADAGFFRCMLASMLIAALLSLLVGRISLKLSQDYFAIGTLAFSSVVSALLVNWKSVTHGVLGIPGIPRPVVFGFDCGENLAFLILVAGVALVVQIALYLISKGSFARQLRAQAEFDFAAKSLAVDTQQVRSWSFVVSSAVAGIGGCLFAYYMNYIDPSSFMLNEMVFVLTIVVVGSPGSFFGCLIGTIFLFLLPEPLRFIDFEPGVLGPMRQLLYALILLGVIFWRRDSLFPVRREI